MKRKLKRILALLLIMTIYVSTMNISAFATEKSGLEQNSWDGTITQSVYEGENYKITYSLKSYWNGGYNANIKIENKGESVIENWYLSYTSNDIIANIWNAEVYSHENKQYIIKNVGWNQNIDVGGTVEFGFNGSGNFTGFPKGYNILGQNTEDSKEYYSVEYNLSSDWGSGFTGAISITNKTDKIIEDWTLEFYYDRTITNIWNGVIETREGNHYVVKNAGYNSNIAAGQTIFFGFNGIDGVAKNSPYNYKLFSFKVNSTEQAKLPEEKIEKEYLERAVYPYLILKGISVDDINMSDDYDEDGLTLIQEYEYDTNPFSKDTDEDGLSDYEEIYIYGTNPIKDDSDDDEMSDGTETACGLNPLNSDTDGNGVKDSQETVTQIVRIDTVKKYELQEVGTLPNIEITGKGDYSQKIYAAAIENDATILNINCLVGTAFDFIHDEELTFEKSQLTFKISDEILEKNTIEELAIAWYNEEKNALELLETTYDIENHNISAEVSHYSTYMVVFVPAYFFDIDWENENSNLESGKADVVFVVDTTGSMGDEIRNVRNNIETFVSELEKNKVDIRLGLVEYKDIYEDGIGSTKSYDWYNNVDSFKTKLSSLSVEGGGDGPESVVDALYCARNMKFRTGVKKYIILLTDADYKNGTSISSRATLTDEIEKLSENEIVTSVVTVPDYYSVYRELINQTDGICANINQNFASALSPLISKMGEQVNKGCWVRLSNGSVVSLDKDPTIGDETVDTDEDGVPDVIELKSSYKVRAYNPNTGKIQEINTWSFYSNPVKKDTDGDTLSDFDDLQPTIYDIVVEKENDDYVKFNTGKKWNKITCTSFDYLDNLMQMVDGNVDNPIPLEEFRRIVQNVTDNANQDFTIEELIYIGIIDNEGSKLYMHDLSETARETVFQKIADRESRYYRHSGIWFWENWSEVSKGTESGFWKGTVLSEADINFSWKIYNICDVYSVLSSVVQAGALVIEIVLVVEVTPVILANIQGLTYYVKNFGVIQGFQMYRYLGIQNLPDGVISWLQMDMADGESSIQKIDVNKLHHIFGKKEHNLDKFLDSYGGNQVNAYNGLLNATQEYIERNNIIGTFKDIIVNVNGYSITVRGYVENNIVRIGTAFIP